VKSTPQWETGAQTAFRGSAGKKRDPLLFLLKDHHGHALLIAEAASQAEADAFGRTHLQEFNGESIEIDDTSRRAAEEFWGVRTVRVADVLFETTRTVTALAENKARKQPVRRPAAVSTEVVVHGLGLPEDVEADDLLTPEDRRDLALDHIARTCEFVVHIEIRKWS
jgi:hypothetical protein